MIGLWLLKKRMEGVDDIMAVVRSLPARTVDAQQPPVTPEPAAPVTLAPSGQWTENASSVSIRDRYALAVEAGFTPDDAVIMAAISLRECRGCNMRSINASGDVSLWQINRVHWSATGGPDVLVDPHASARAARMVWSGAGGGERGFRQWCTYPYGCGLTPPMGGNPTPAEFAQTVEEVRRGIA